MPGQLSLTSPSATHRGNRPPLCLLLYNICLTCFVLVLAACLTVHPEYFSPFAAPIRITFALSACPTVCFTVVDSLVRLLQPQGHSLGSATASTDWYLVHLPWISSLTLLFLYPGDSVPLPWIILSSVFIPVPSFPLRHLLTSCISCKYLLCHWFRLFRI